MTPHPARVKKAEQAVVRAAMGWFAADGANDCVESHRLIHACNALRAVRRAVRSAAKKGKR